MRRSRNRLMPGARRILPEPYDDDAEVASSGDPGTVLPRGNYKLLHCWRKQAPQKILPPWCPQFPSYCPALLCWAGPSTYKEMTSWAFCSPLPRPPSWCYIGVCWRVAGACLHCLKLLALASHPAGGHAPSGHFSWVAMSFAISLFARYQSGFLRQRGSWKILSVSNVFKGGPTAPATRYPVSQTLTARPARSWPLNSLSPSISSFACCLLSGSPVPVTKHKGLFSVLSETYGHKKVSSLASGRGQLAPLRLSVSGRARKGLLPPPASQGTGPL